MSKIIPINAGATVWLFLSLPLAIAACSAPINAPSRSAGPAVSASTQARQSQVDHLRLFDHAVASQPTDCDGACAEQRHICALSTRLCTISRDDPNDARAAESCEAGASTCRDTTNRIPDSCLCDE